MLTLKSTRVFLSTYISDIDGSVGSGGDQILGIVSSSCNSGSSISKINYY